MRYVGGKHRLAKIIAPELTKTSRGTYVEPFVGGGAILSAVSRSFARVIACDLHQDLILLWKAVQDGWEPPEVITEELYREVKQQEPSALRGFVGFGATFGGKWFGGYARGRKTDGTPRNYAAETLRNIHKMKQSGAFDDHVEFHNVDSILFMEKLMGDRSVDLGDTVVYCDPPYVDTQGYSTGLFDTEKFWGLCVSLAEHGAMVYVSEYNIPGSVPVREVFSKEHTVFLDKNSRKKNVERFVQVLG